MRQIRLHAVKWPPPPPTPPPPPPPSSSSSSSSCLSFAAFDCAQPAPPVHGLAAFYPHIAGIFATIICDDGYKFTTRDIPPLYTCQIEGAWLASDITIDPNDLPVTFVFPACSGRSNFRSPPKSSILCDILRQRYISLLLSASRIKAMKCTLSSSLYWFHTGRGGRYLQNRLGKFHIISNNVWVYAKWPLSFSYFGYWGHACRNRQSQPKFKNEFYNEGIFLCYRKLH